MIDSGDQRITHSQYFLPGSAFLYVRPFEERLSGKFFPCGRTSWFRVVEVGI
jgi:hypothetical protein